VSGVTHLLQYLTVFYLLFIFLSEVADIFLGLDVVPHLFLLAFLPEANASVAPDSAGILFYNRNAHFSKFNRTQIFADNHSAVEPQPNKMP
jgi:hypothetical protein